MKKYNHYTKIQWKPLMQIPLFAMLLLSIMLSACEDDTPVNPDPDVPAVLSTSPDDNEDSVAVNTEITATFSQDMDATSLTDSTFFVSDNGENVNGIITISGRTATLTPNNDLNTNTEYVATITSEARSENGVSMDENYDWSFTTGDSIDDTTGTDTTGTDALQDTLNLGSTAGFAILSRTGITHTGESEINGDIGISPGTSEDISGFELTADTAGEFATAPGVNGNIYASDYSGGTPDMLVQAEDDIITAYTNSIDESRGTANALSDDLNAQTLTPGLYEAESINLSENSVLTLDAEGNPDAVFLIRSTSSLTTGSGSEVVLTGNAQPQNVYWISGSDVDLGQNSVMHGTLLSGGGFKMSSGASLVGRLLLQGENASDITLEENTITVPGVVVEDEDV